MRTAISAFCFLLLLATVAMPYRVNFSAGPFTTISVLDIALIVSAVYLGARYVLFMPLYLGPRVLTAAILIPVAIAILSIAWATSATLSGASAAKYVYTALCYFVALQFGREWSHSTIERLLLVVLCCWLAGSIAMYLSVPGFEFFVAESAQLSQGDMVDLLAAVFTRLGHPYLGQSNDYAPLLAFIGFILLGHACLHKSVPAGVFAGVSFIAGALTFSRGVVGGLLIALACYAICVRASIRRLALTGIAVGLGIVIVWFLVRDVSVELVDRQIDMTQAIESRVSASNIDARLEMYQETLALVRERPFLGYGVGFYDPRGSFVSVHSAYLEQWRYFGVILGTLTSICYLMPLVYFFGLRAKAPRIAAWSDAIACGWLVLVLSSSVETFFEANVPRAVIYILLGLCVATTAKLLRSHSRTVQITTTPLPQATARHGFLNGAPRAGDE